MERMAFEARVADMKRRAHGRWTELLIACGVAEALLNRRNQPCPLCGGVDRFQYTDRFGEGNYHCRGCGPGGGIKLLQAYLGWDFGTVLRRIEECVGTSAPLDALPAPTVSERMQALTRRLWEQARPVQPGDEVASYLARRGLSLATFPPVLRCHPQLGYYEKVGNKSVCTGTYAAMVACVQGPDSRVATLHRTYLSEGGKVIGKAARKLLCAGARGGAVRLCAAGEELAVAEGIETALAVHCATGKPAWAALSAANLVQVWIPPGVRRVAIYADNDAHRHFDGQAAAYALASRLMKEPTVGPGRTVAVYVPPRAGQDWADVWAERAVPERCAA